MDTRILIIYQCLVYPYINKVEFWSHFLLSLCQDMEVLDSVLRSRGSEGDPEDWEGHSGGNLASSRSSSGLSRQERSRQLWEDISMVEEDSSKLNALQLRLDESQKVLLKERE